MKMSSSRALPVLLIMSALWSGTALARTEAPVADQAVKIDGVQTVCTGSGKDARAEARWHGYPLRLEFVGKSGEYLGNETVTLAGHGKNVSVHCTGPWVLMNVPKGTYRLSADVPGIGHKSMRIHAPGRIVVRFDGRADQAANRH